MCKINTRKMLRPAPTGADVRICKKIEISDGGIRTFLRRCDTRAGGSKPPALAEA